jgi:hypothetical protein
MSEQGQLQNYSVDQVAWAITTQSAAEGGHLECQQYAKENGCPE